MILRRSIVVVSLLLAGVIPAMADLTYSEKVKREIPMLIGGTFVLQNTAGDIDIVGTDETKVVFIAEKIVRGVDKDAIEEGKQQTQIAVGGNGRMSIVRTLVPNPNLRNGWASGMNYTVRVPRTVQVKVTSLQASHIRVAGIRGNVNVKSNTGVVTLENVTGPAFVESANGDVVFNAPPQGLADTQLTSVNGNVEVHVPQSARFQWIAQIVKGEARTTFRITATLINNRYVANVNGSGGPTITTQSFSGNVAVLQNGALYAAAHSIRSTDPSADFAGQLVRKNFETASVQGLLRFTTLLGDVTIGAVHGGAEITTGAGEVQLGTVFGPCQVISGGGPLTLGQIMGTLLARTEAGDVIVESARQGGTITTGGGIIRLTSTGGPTRLQSGGGDIVVRMASGPVIAETQSGDISITIDPASKTEKVSAKTAKGNVLLSVSQAFAADIDATVITSEPDVNKILSDFTGLSFRREQVGGKTKIRATGKVNGGGGRVELYAEDGGIQISTRSGAVSASIQP
ncbi:MAG TPA: DUF4097 family beta strand repeat-containing protein [Thermoanaerobaculia bacterium]|nr:DUF4097 family beta strand repeat-containing protein [Thermoanaerobaculia bacterium]